MGQVESHAIGEGQNDGRVGEEKHELGKDDRARESHGLAECGQKQEEKRSIDPQAEQRLIQNQIHSSHGRCRLPSTCLLLVNRGLYTCADWEKNKINCTYRK